MTQTSTCLTCGDKVTADSSACPFCRAHLAWKPGEEPSAPTRSVRAAVDAWGATVFATPAPLSRLVSSVDVKDEQVERLATHVLRRTLREERLPGSYGQCTAPKLPFASVDAFSFTVETLRDVTAHLTACAACSGARAVRCGRCGGGGKERCSTCSGSGSITRYYKNGNTRLIKCTVCRGKMVLICQGCIGSGSIACPPCSGSGNQLSWLTYDQTDRWLVDVTKSPVVVAHPRLKEARPIAEAELEAFSIVSMTEAAGPLDDSDDNTWFDQHLRTVDPQTERIVFQQHLRVAVQRRDVRFGFCATKGTLVLSGNGLIGSRTSDALRPTRTRLLVWLVAVLVLAVAAMLFTGAAVKPLPYFERFRSYLLAATWLAWLLSILTIGALLREIKPGFGFGRLRSSELGLTTAAAAMALSAVGLAFAAKPRVEEVHKALAANQLATARVTLEALLAVEGKTSSVLAALDTTQLAEAKQAAPDQRLDLLDAVVSRHGGQSAEAAKLARAERVTRIQAALTAHSPADAFNLADRWFAPATPQDADIAELRAQANDQLRATCATSPCRYAAARKAAKAATTPARVQAVGEATDALLADLEFTSVLNEAPPAMLRRLTKFTELARYTAEVSDGEPRVSEAAKLATSFAQSERARVALIGSQEEAVTELLGPLTAAGKNISMKFTDTVSISVVFDAQRRCRGLYVAGGGKPRTLTSRDWSADAFLSQAVGHPATLKAAATSQTTVRWVEAGVPIVARWHDSNPVELRIADAAP